MSNKIVLYHGSSSIIEKPIYGAGNIYNDYGVAFYCTRVLDMAKEWAVSENTDGYVNIYEIDMNGITVLDLNNEKYHLLNWMAILLENRLFRANGMATDAKNYILENFAVDYKSYDVIKGYRADDSYFSFANAFLENTLPLEKLGEVMRLGDLGEQYAIKTKKAFDRIEYKGYECSDRLVYFPKKKQRDEAARMEYKNNYKNYKNGTFMIDIMREEWKVDDERLRYFLCR